MKKILLFLTSLRFSFILLVVLLGVIVQRAIIAQRYFLSPDPAQVPLFLRGFDYLGLSSIELLNRIFWGVLSILVVSLFFSISRMIKAGKARRRGLGRFKTVEAIQQLGNTKRIHIAACDPDKIKSFFRRKGFRIQDENHSSFPCFFAVKHDLGQWGVIIFHLTFFLLFLGGIASFLTRFTGYFELAPGEIFVEKYDHYLQKTPKPMFFNADNAFSVTLEEINLAYWKPGEVKQRASIVRIIDKNGRLRGTPNISVNNPYAVANVKIYQGSRHGFIAGLKVTDREGTTANGVVRFLLTRGAEPELVTWVRLPGTALDLKLELYSDLVRKIEGLEHFYSSRFEGSLMKVSSVERGGKLQSHGVVFGGGSLDVDDLDLRFVSLKPFTSFIITRDYGVPIIFVGFVFLLLSLCLTYFWVPERYWITIQEKDTGYSVYVGASVDKYKESFKERFSRLMNEFEAVITA